MAEETVLMAFRYERGRPAESEPVVVTADAERVVVTLDDGELLIFDARELRKAVELVTDHGGDAAAFADVQAAREAGAA